MSRKKRVVARDLSPEQNARFRKILKAYMEEECEGTLANLERVLGVRQPSLTRFFGGGGASYSTVQKFAALTGRSVTELIGNGNGNAAKDMAAGTLLLLLRTRPALEQVIALHPSRWSVEALVKALLDPQALAADTVESWTTILDRAAKQPLRR